MRAAALALAVGIFGGFAAAGVRGASPQAQTGSQAAGAGRGSAPTTGSGLLMGQVVDGSTGKPIGDAIVSIGGGGRGSTVVVGGRGSAPPAAPMRVLADAQGRFLFRDLAAGSFTLTAVKPGYFGGASGQQTPRGESRPIELLDAERLGGVTLRLWAFGVVSGTVSDSSGAPVPGVDLQLLRRTAVNGAWNFTAGQTTTTDDRGEYRMGSVLPGDYLAAVRSSGTPGGRLIMALVASDEAMATRVLPKIMERGEESLIVDDSVRLYPQTFYPGVAQVSQAIVIAVESGAERAGVDFQVSAAHARTVAGKVVGRAFDANGPSVMLELHQDTGDGDVDPNPAGSMMDPSGRFLFTGVPEGRYVLEAVARPRNPNGAGRGARGGRGGGGAGGPVLPAPDDPTLFASMPVVVGDHSIADLVVTLAACGRVSGRVDFDGDHRPPLDLWTQIAVTLEPVAGAAGSPSTSGRVESDGTFRTASVQPGRYLLRVGSLTVPGVPAQGALAGAPAVWRARAAMVNGSDALDQPLDLDLSDVTNVVVTFTDKPAAALSGTVRDDKGDGDPRAAVLVFSTDSRLWADRTGSSRRVRLSKTSRYGLYSLAGLPAGEYFVLAADADRFVDLQAPGALESLARLATRLTVADGDKKTLDLKSGGR